MNAANQIVRESITTALLLMMETQSYESITITDLTKRAGVGRVSFYRNYHAKEDILLEHLADEGRAWWKTVEAKGPTDPVDFVRQVFVYFQHIGPVLQLLYKADLSHLLMKHLRDWCGPKEGMNNLEAYAAAVSAAIWFGWCDEWVRRGMQESPEDMAKLFHASQINKNT